MKIRRHLRRLHADLWHSRYAFICVMVFSELVNFGLVELFQLVRFESAVGLISVMVNWNGESLRVLRTKMFGISAFWI